MTVDVSPFRMRVEANPSHTSSSRKQGSTTDEAILRRRKPSPRMVHNTGTSAGSPWGVSMSYRETVVQKIETAFAANVYPGARFLDGHATALSFFSEAGFRYFLPAYLISDLRGQLYTADPLFHQTHGFSDWTTEVPAADRTLKIKHGKSALMNPRRYGA